jgi:mixed-linked glucan synthase
MTDASLGLVFNAWVLLLISPFMLGIILIALVYIAIQAMRTGFVLFHFRHAGGASFPTSWGF